MTFLSFGFPFFMLIVLFAYYTVPKKYQWIVLLLASYYFFWTNSRYAIVFLFITSLISFLFAKKIYALKSVSSNMDKDQQKEYKRKQKRVLIVGVALIVLILIFLKYSGFFIDNFNSLLKSDISIAVKIIVPMGISYYTLETIAYMIDVYRNKIEPEDNLFKYMLFVSFFPKIVQGPISRFKQLDPQLVEEHSFDSKRFYYGIQLIIWALVKKLIISDRIAIPVNEIFNNYSKYSGPSIFLAGAFYGIQVYTDFSAGIDIASGVSNMLGIEIEKNFIQPYFSTSVEDFWRRWHKTLGAWMKDYVFYPLTLSKPFSALGKKAKKLFGASFGKKLPAFIAMFIVYFIVGLWHGPQWKYVAYGIYNGVFIMCGIMFKEFYEKVRTAIGIKDENVITWRVFQIIRTFSIISLGRLFSKSNGLKAALKMIKSLFVNPFSSTSSNFFANSGLDTANWLLLTVFLVILFVVDYLHEKNISIRDEIAKQPFIFRWIIYTLVILCILIFGMYGPEYSNSSFIYEQF